MRLLLIGAPGSGKGTQGARLAEASGVQHLATGDLLRAEVDGATALGAKVAATLRRGELVPDDLITAAVAPALYAAAGAGGYILDGFPRTVRQLELLDRLGEERGVLPQRVVFLDVDDDLLRHRLLARAKEQGRSDDTPEVIARRLEVFRAETQPVIDVYGVRGVLTTVDGARAPDDISREILALVDRQTAW